MIRSILFIATIFSTANAVAARRPNIVYIMSDELAYYELSHMGNPYIRTPRIDKMAGEGIRFTQALAGAPVCAPLRCSLMTGKHMGHASVRANDGGTPLRAEEQTIASILKELGYATGGFGKWGAGGRGSTGVPEKHGFDTFFGYYDQVHAHSYYPPYLIENSAEVKLPGNNGGRSGRTYSHYEIINRGLEFIRENKDRPFFCYLPITPPHGMYDIPKDDPAWQLYKDAEWMKDESVSKEAKNYAAMVSMVDRNVGQVLDLLRELDIEDNTIVFFTGDNGGQDRFRNKEHPRGFFGPNVNPRTGVEFRGGKGNLYEGGLRIPFIVRWPGKIEAGQVSDLLFYQPDILPTLAELTTAKVPEGVDGLSVLPTLLGEGTVGRKQKQHEYLYWEYRSQTAVRMKNWKAVKPGKNGAWELYDLDKDISEQNNIAADHPEILQKMKAFAKKAHEPVRPGTFADRTNHEKDRWAKWGTSRGGAIPGGKVNSLPKEGAISNKSWRLASCSSENTANRKLAKFAIDGDPRTIWHSRFTPKLEKHPHELVIDLGGTYDVSAVRYLARQDNGWNGTIKKCEVFVCPDEDSFGKPLAVVELKKTKKPQEITFDPVRGRFVKIRALSEINGGPWASAAEIGVVGKSVKQKR